jgi:hypothetical protein
LAYWCLKENWDFPGEKVAGPTRLELATSGVTGQRSNQTELRPRLGDSHYNINSLELSTVFLKNESGLIGTIRQKILFFHTISIEIIIFIG